MKVYWLEQTETDVPPENDWFSADELARLGNLRFAKRRADWRLGRWTAKRAVAIWLEVPANPETLAEIEVRPAPSGAPELFVVNQHAAVSLSLSHRDGRAICALAPSSAELGCDLELIEPRSDAFISDYFTPEEQALIAQEDAADRPRLLALLWSAKESTLKAVRTGLRVDTRSVIVSPGASMDPHGWSPLRVQYEDGQAFRGWWQLADNFVRTLVAAPPPDPPIRLLLPDYAHDRTTLCA